LIAPTQANDPRARRARASLEAHLQRLSVGLVKLMVAFVLVWALTQVIALIFVVGGVGFGRAWRTGAFGQAIAEVIKMGVLGLIASFAARPVLRRVYADLIARGVVVEVRITQGPDFFLERALGGAIDVMFLDRLLGLLVPTRIANFNYDYQGTAHGHESSFLYPDETTGADEDGAGALVLVDPQNPSARGWLVRRRGTASPR